MNITIQVNKFLKYLLIILTILFIFNAFIHIIKELTGHDYMMGLFRLFDFYSEANFPTWYSTILLAISSMLFYIIFHLNTENTDKYYWLIMAFIFLFLSLDEFAQLHELIGSFINKTRASNLLPGHKNTWVFWGGSLSLLVGIAFFKFWLRLEKEIRNIFLLAAIIYIGGALGFEVVEIYYVATFGINFGFDILVAIEETMEMLGIIILIWGLLKQIVQCNTVYKLNIR